MIVGTQIINQIQTVISRITDPSELSVINIGEFKAGSAPNVIADEAYLSASIRSTNEKTRQKMAQTIKAIVNNTCQTYGAIPEMDYQFYYGAVVNDAKLSALVEKSARQVLDSHLVTHNGKISASEDFSAYGTLAPLCYFVLGGGLAADGYQYANHSPKFIIDENALINGVKT
ncbi:amidohydrolase, partial [Lactobacillus sp. XV13L]|nr:amidohydrolase [Lactobacillus sp. XV13L]